jgi:hypothetical protein
VGQERTAVVEFMQQGTTVMTRVYCEKLKICRTIQNESHGMVTSGVVLHDSVRLHTHTAAHTQALLEHFS